MKKTAKKRKCGLGSIENAEDEGGGNGLRTNRDTVELRKN